MYSIRSAFPADLAAVSLSRRYSAFGPCRDDEGVIAQREWVAPPDRVGTEVPHHGGAKSLRAALHSEIGPCSGSGGG
jgi:hypothetical protein